MIKLESLRVFVSVAETGSIGGAADRLGRTPSAISMSLKRLEGEIGSSLFSSDRKSSLTPLGEFVLESSRAQLWGFDRSVLSIRDFAAGRSGRLTVAAVPSVSSEIFPPLVSEFLSSRPRADVDLYDVDSSTVRQLVSSGEADLGVGSHGREDPSLEFDSLFRDRFLVICSSSSSLSRLGSPLRWEDVADRKLLRNGSSEALRHPEYLRLRSSSPMMVRNVSSLFALVRSDFGISFYPSLASEALPDGVVAREIGSVPLAREVGVLRRREIVASPIAESFRRLILDRTPGLIASRDVEDVSCGSSSLASDGSVVLGVVG